MATRTVPDPTVAAAIPLSSSLYLYLYLERNPHMEPSTYHLADPPTGEWLAFALLPSVRIPPWMARHHTN